MSLTIPRLVVAGTHSGVGKTTVATGLMAAFADRGRRVTSFKVGPDFIDPSYHRLATGRPARNLDAVLSGADRLAPLFAHGARDADIAVVEGVMGLFDGAARPLPEAGDTGPGAPASTAHVARLLDAPIVLVVDAGALSTSVAAIVHGFVSFDPALRVAGVVCNRVGSERHAQLLAEALDPLGVPMLGTLPVDERIAAPSKHLGLVPAAERDADARRAVGSLGQRLAERLDLERVERIAADAPPVHDPAWDPAEAVDGEVPHERAPGPAPRVAVAGGPAFTFTYPEHRELLAAAGADVLDVDPVRDPRLPEGTDALVVGGGFPETYADELSANATLRAEVAALAARDAPILAECGGLLYLARALDGREMCGVLPAEAAMTEKLVLGYREATAATDSVAWHAGERSRGHEFHRTRIAPGVGAQPAWHLDDRPEGFVAGSVHASYLHTHWSATPAVAARVMRGARARGGRRRVAP
ncbi:cobyrinate a,c-diamide synthase [Egibacter rhizosphaerae]|uniref:Hydrogenobyrinate a,c-diamide synthase n=1 Tax=Egibacter rhizosphaerae TaxID=1670831 RepID=A0A411YF27_9ACTN|nr:cobyrinate a,c-diamide synthase [Egibacter rhizosphaerae]QBI19820.1 cobyrinate a,c-diamide synthase [Egibacter rhizosphaerae]